MGFTNYGLVQLGSFIKGDSPAYPQYLEFGGGSRLFTGSVNYLENGFTRKAITWTWNGSNPRGAAQLLTTDAVGSNIQEVGFGSGAAVGSDLYARDLSAIGDKTNAFTVDVTWEIRFRR